MPSDVPIRRLVLAALLPFALVALELPVERPRQSEGVQQLHAVATVKAERHLADQTTPKAEQEVQKLIAGVPGRLAVKIAGAVLWNPQLYRAGRVRIRPEGSLCGGPGSSQMSDAVYPSCAGSICHGATARSGQNASWNGVRITRVGRYQLCWCAPRATCAGPDAGLTGPGCCDEDADFSRAAGLVEVDGPSWISLSPLLGNPFRIDMTGTVVHWSSRVQLRFRPPRGTGVCGEPRSAAEREASSVQVWNGRFEDGKAKLEARVFRGIPYVVCWCAGDRHQLIDQDCSADESFSAEVGYVSPIGPHTEGLPPQHAVVGAPFSLALRGLGLGTGDRLRIVDGSSECGTDASKNALPVAEYICGRGKDPCVNSPIYDGPPSEIKNVTEEVGNATAEMAEMEEAWQPVVVFTPGTYKLCWCVDNSWDPVRLDSHGLCGSNEHFAIAAGTLRINGIYHGQKFECTSFAPCTLQVHSPMPMSSGDAIMIAAQRKDRWHFCGRGMEGLQARAASVQSIGSADDTGMQNSSAIFHILPNAGPAGEFPICFCQSATVGVCDDPAVFGQLAGTLRVMPPADGTLLHEEPPKFCHVKRACRWSIVGVWAIQLHKDDAFSVVEKGVKCGTTDVSTVFRLEQRLALPSGEWKAVYTNPYEDPWPQQTGDFRLCYCSASLASGKVCDSQADFSQDMAGLIILGSTVSGRTWTCRQAQNCTLTVPGWRISPTDRLLLVQTHTPCGGTPYEAMEVTGGFDQNPAVNPVVDLGAGGWIARFSFGRALGAGPSRVCFCASTTAAHACEELEDFLQDVGEVSVLGSLASVKASPAQPATAYAVSVIVDVLTPGSVTCAVTNSVLTRPPSIYEVVYCREKLPGCLGSAQLPWRAMQGRNIIHIPITLTATAQSNRIAHAWCIGDPADCPAGGYCAMPPTATGLELLLEDGAIPWTPQRTSVEEVVNISIQGDPLLTRNGFVSSHVDSGADCDTHGRNDRDNALALDQPTHTQPMAAMHWHDVAMEHPGRYRLCWCDRSYAYDYCVRWHTAGLLTVAGPLEEAAMPAIVAQQEAYIVLLQGIDLTMQSRIRVVPLPDSSQLMTTASADAVVPEASRVCKNQSLAALPNVTAPVWANGSFAQWNFSAPTAEGHFSLCWGEVGGPMSVFIGHVYVQARRDCVMSNWTALECDQICGGGTLEEYQWIVQNATGGGEPCPGAESMARRLPCNTQPCPEAEAFRAWTIPSFVQTGEPFQVYVEGQEFAPHEDRVHLLTGEADCNSSSVHLAGAGCQEPGSSIARLVCGDGKYTLRLAEPGFYRICICDASKENVNGGLASPNTSTVPCSGGAYTLTPANGSVFRVSGPRKPLESFVDFEQEDSRPRPMGNSYKEDDAEDKVSMFVLVGAAVGGVLHCLLVFAVWWRCFRQKESSENSKSSKGVDTEELVRQATREVWNAYARAVAEGVDDEELRETSHAILEANAAEEEEEAAGKEIEYANSVYSRQSSSRRWSLHSTSTDSSLYSGEDTSTSQMTSTDEFPTRATTPATPGPSRVPTPTRTPPPTPGVSRVPTPSTAGQRTPTPGTARTPTGGSARTATPGTARTARSMASRGTARSASRPSLLQVELPAPGKPTAPPKAGGSFLDMPLLGRSSTGGAASASIAPTPPRSTTPPPKPADEPPVLDLRPENTATAPPPAEEPPSQPPGEPPLLETPVSPSPLLSASRPKTPVGRPPPLTMLELPAASEPPEGTLGATQGCTPPSSPPHSSRQHPDRTVDETPALEATPTPVSARSSSALPSATARPPGFHGNSQLPPGVRPPSRSLLPGQEACSQSRSPREPMGLLADLKVGARAAATGLALPKALPPPPPPPKAQPLSISEEAAAFIRSLGSNRNATTEASLEIEYKAPEEQPDTPAAPSSQPPPLGAAEAECKAPEQVGAPAAPSSQPPPLSSCQDNDDEPFKDTRSTWSGIGSMLPGSLALAASPSSRGSVETPRERSPSPQPAAQECTVPPAQRAKTVNSLQESPPQPSQHQEDQLIGQAKPAAEALADRPAEPSSDIQAEASLQLPVEPLHGLDAAVGADSAPPVATNSSQASGWSLTNFVGSLRLPWSRSRRAKSRVGAVPLAAIAEGLQQSSEQEQTSPGLEPRQALRSKHQPLKDVHAEPEDERRERKAASAALPAETDLRAGGLSEPVAADVSSRGVHEPAADDAMPRGASEPPGNGTRSTELEPAKEDLTPGQAAETTEDAPVEPSIASQGRGMELTPEVEPTAAPELDLEETVGSVSPSTQAGPSPTGQITPGGQISTFLSDDGSSPAASNVLSQPSSRCGLRDELRTEQGSEANGLETGRSSLVESLPNSAMPSSRSFGMRSNALDAQERIRAEWYKRLKADTDWDKVSSPKSTSLRPRHGGTEGSTRPSASSLRSAASRRGGDSRSTPASSEAPSAAASPRSLAPAGPAFPRSPNASGAGRGLPGPALPGMPGPALPGMPGPALPGMPGPALPGMPGPSVRLLPGPSSASSPKGQMLPGPPMAEAVRPGLHAGHRPNQHGHSGKRPPSWAFVAP